MTTSSTAPSSVDGGNGNLLFAVNCGYGSLADNGTMDWKKQLLWIISVKRRFTIAIFNYWDDFNYLNKGLSLTRLNASA